MAQQIKTMHDGEPHSILDSQWVETTNSKKLSSDLYMHPAAHTHTDAQIYTHTEQ